MAWYQVYKTYRGGKSPIDYFEVPEGYSTEEEEIEEHAKEWAESINGGHSYGYTVYWEKVKYPPVYLLTAKVLCLQSKAKDCEAEAHRLELLIEEIKNNGKDL